jgi:Flp pilus assembly protein TadD
MGDPVIREKRTGLVSAKSFGGSASTSSTAEASAAKTADIPQADYAQRHVARAKTYIASKCYNDAIQELRDAVRIAPESSNYHSMLGQAYLLQKMTGMAKVHIRKALTLDPKNAIAQKYAKQLDIDLKVSPRPASKKNANGHTKSGGLLNFFGKRRATK